MILSSVANVQIQGVNVQIPTIDIQIQGANAISGFSN